MQEIEVEFKENVEIGANFRVDAYRPLKLADRLKYGEFWISLKSASLAARFSENWLQRVLATHKKHKNTLDLLLGLGFGDTQLNVKVVNHPTHRSAKPISVQDLPVILQYASIYGESVEQRTHASSLLLAGNVEYLKYRLRQAWGVETSEEQARADFTQSYRHYRTVLEKLVGTYPAVSGSLVEAQSPELKISAPLKGFYQAIYRKLKARYPRGVIQNRHLKEIKKDITLLASYVEEWKFVTRKKLHLQLGLSNFEGIGKSPDFSILIPINIDGHREDCLFMFEFADKLVEQDFVESILGRRYLAFARNCLGIKHVFQIFVSPLGATPLAEQYIRSHELLSESERNSIGVLTTMELVSMLRNQAYKTANGSGVKGEINAICKRLAYNIPQSHNDFVLSDDTLPLLAALNLQSGVTRSFLSP
jgi:hypothetical protein